MRHDTDQKLMLNLACHFLEDITANPYELLNHSELISLDMLDGDGTLAPENSTTRRERYRQLQVWVSNYGTPHKSQLPDDRDAWSDNKADRTGGAVTALRPTWSSWLEYQSAFRLEIEGLPNVNIWFGAANDTFGASIHDDNGADIGYLETRLDHDALPVEELAAGAVAVVEKWLNAGRPTETVFLT